jgi:hypothetical protein
MALFYAYDYPFFACQTHAAIHQVLVPLPPHYTRPILQAVQRHSLQLNLLSRMNEKVRFQLHVDQAWGSAKWLTVLAEILSAPMGLEHFSHCCRA